MLSAERAFCFRQREFNETFTVQWRKRFCRFRFRTTCAIRKTLIGIWNWILKLSLAKQTREGLQNKQELTGVRSKDKQFKKKALEGNASEITFFFNLKHESSERAYSKKNYNCIRPCSCDLCCCQKYKNAKISYKNLPNVHISLFLQKISSCVGWLADNI